MKDHEMSAAELWELRPSLYGSPDQRRVAAIAYVERILAAGRKRAEGHPYFAMRLKIARAEKQREIVEWLREPEQRRRSKGHSMFLADEIEKRGES